LKTFFTITVLLFCASLSQAHGGISQSDSVFFRPDSGAMPAFTKAYFDSVHAENAKPIEFKADEPKIDGLKFATSVAVLGTAIVGVHLIQYNSWWKDQRGPFHVYNDPDYKANFDKFGHAFGAYYTAHFFNEAYSWSGFDSSQSTLLAATSAALFELYVEVEDGFATSWGFSPGDAKADIAGATFYVVRNAIPLMRNFNYKWTYWPSQQYLEQRPDIQGQSQNFIEDYAGQSYWITANIDGLLPRSAKGIIPSWLNLAFGVGSWSLDAAIDTTAGAKPFDKRKKAYYISVDYDIDKIIPESDIGILNFIRRAFGYWHFPAPALMISPEVKFYVLFPFRMTIG
jgi:hypothetical protein